jgi:glycosyltransferase Alg8
MTQNKKAIPKLDWLILLLIWVAALICLYLLRNNTDRVTFAGWENMVVLGIIGIWRWSWLVLHAVRSCLYRVWVFPRWRRKANRIPIEELPPIAIVIPTYKEKTWITERVFRAIAKEAKTLHRPLTLVPVTTPEENQAIAEIIKSEDPELGSVNLMGLLDPAKGKRGALAVGLQALREANFPENGVVALMDGDSEMAPGSLRLSLPFFHLFPKMGALTTNEMPEVYGSYFFSEWLHLRFCQRHQYMCSHALSNKVLCLTGRCSLFRASAALDPSFAELLANDFLNDWLWGQFRFFSGDDKSTWYWLLSRGYDMLYLPDVMVYTVETISGSIVDRSYQNMRRWSGNMLRNGTRALALGVNQVGLFTWLCVLDQRINIWTTLISPGILLITLLEKNWLGAAMLCCWFLITRPMYLFMVFWGRESHLKVLHLPILIFAQWATSLIKIWTQMNLAQQKWTNRHGNKKGAGEKLQWGQLFLNGLSRILLLTQSFAFVVFLLWQYGTVSVHQDIAGWWWHRQNLTPETAVVQVIEAMNHGVIPSDRQDDSQALQALLDGLPPTGNVQINLPLGQIDLFHPVQINRSHTCLIGQGTQGTIFQAHPQALQGKAILTVQPKKKIPGNYKLENIELTDFSVDTEYLTSRLQKPSILLANIKQSAVKNISLNSKYKYALKLAQSEQITVEYVSINGRS